MAYGVSDIYSLVEKYRYSFSTIEYLADNYGFSRADKILAALRSPVKRYALRVNTLKIRAEDALEELQDHGVKAEADKNIRDIIYIPTSGPHDINRPDKVIFADKFRS